MQHSGTCTKGGSLYRDPGTSPGTEDLGAREERQPDTKIVKGFLHWSAPQGHQCSGFFSALHSTLKPSLKTLCSFLKNTLALLDSPGGFPVPVPKPGFWKRKRRAGRSTSSPGRPETLLRPCVSLSTPANGSWVCGPPAAHTAGGATGVCLMQQADNVTASF